MAKKFKKLSKKRFQFVILECINCKNKLEKCNHYSSGVSRYYTLKLRTTEIKKLIRFKYCKYCRKHTLHEENK